MRNPWLTDAIHHSHFFDLAATSVAKPTSPFEFWQGQLAAREQPYNPLADWLIGQWLSLLH